MNAGFSEHLNNNDSDAESDASVVTSASSSPFTLPRNYWKSQSATEVILEYSSATKATGQVSPSASKVAAWASLDYFPYDEPPRLSFPQRQLNDLVSSELAATSTSSDQRYNDGILTRLLEWCSQRESGKRQVR